ncbi:hypothetical protein RUM44_009775 [Polyplax serrata]|uniref:Uncharacterized protein n=1 Tax=Polyplax serrata TaxID=468196 RepID=A0ABR1ATM7_POLSC
MCRAYKFDHVADKRNGSPWGQQPVDEAHGHCPKGEKRNAKPGTVVGRSRDQSIDGFLRKATDEEGEKRRNLFITIFAPLREEQWEIPWQKVAERKEEREGERENEREKKSGGRRT